MLTYPKGFPCVSRLSHSQAMNAGLIRTPMAAGNTRQRRAFTHMPHVLQLEFEIRQDVYAAWLGWINENAYGAPFLLELPGVLASRAGVGATGVPVRFITDVEANLEPVHRLWYWRVRVGAEWQPLADDVRAGYWIIGGTPAAPGAMWVTGGTPATPSPDITYPGTPAAPVAVV